MNFGLAGVGGGFGFFSFSKSFTSNEGGIVWEGC